MRKKDFKDKIRRFSAMELSLFGQSVENLTDQKLDLETDFWIFLAR